MIQLKVFEDSRRLSQTFLDLYETSPIKLNLSVEDITNAEAKSIFSRTFRVPGTNTNQQFFKHAFYVSGTDYDVTIKKPAEILVDGAEFRQGHIRLQKIYINGDQSKIDYEIIFLGETRDFSSAVGDAAMCALDISSIIHPSNIDNITDSWKAYPTDYAWNKTTEAFESFTSTTTTGLANGDVLYPLADFGNTYNTNNTTIQPKIGLGATSDGDFNHAGNALAQNRLKPMIRARRLMESVFDAAGYSFTSVFMDSALFKQIYVSAWGNEAEVDFDIEANSSNTGQIQGQTIEGFPDDYLLFDTVVSDPGNNFTIGFLGVGQYDIPDAGQTYTISASAFVVATRDDWSGSGPDIPVAQRLKIVSDIQGTLATGSYAYNSTATVQHTFQANAVGPETIKIEVESEASPDRGFTSDANFYVLNATGDADPVKNMDCEYKQIDFVKDVLTTFRLVMAPDPTNPTNFIIEPFVNYIASGDIHDWSHKLDQSKDFIVEPLFFTQSDLIEFNHEEDEDFINKYHYDAYKRYYGYLEFDSGNELLKGKREIKTNWAPTPITQIDHRTASDYSEDFIIPKIHVNETDGGVTKHNPIKPKTRFLFYNGLHDCGPDTKDKWYMVNDANQTPTEFSFDKYPVISYYEEWPPTNTAKVLNWNTDTAYYGDNSPYNSVSDQDLYQVYWGTYIRSLYNKDARRVTAYFTLNNVDLQDFSFDDVIFVNGTYYRPESINDAQIGERTSVKVELIKLLDYGPSFQGGSFTISTSTTAPPCYNGVDGSVEVTASGASLPVTYTTSNGLSGSSAVSPFTISGFAPGTYSITVTDNGGRTDTDTFTVAQSSASQIVGSSTVTAPTTCASSNGQIVLSITGGTPSYTVAWSNGATGTTITGLSNGTYTFTITDSLGCTATGSVLVSCTVVLPSTNIDYIREYENCGICQGETVADCFPFVMVKVSGMSPSSLNGYYVYDGTSADFAINGIYPDLSSTFVVMDQDNTCYTTDWYYGSTFSAAVAAWENCSQTCGNLQPGYINIPNNNRNWVIE